MIEALLVVVGLALGLMVSLTVYLKFQLSLLGNYQKDLANQKLEQEKALKELSELHKATVEKYQKISNDLSTLKGDISGIKLHGPSYGVKKL